MLLGLAAPVTQAQEPRESSVRSREMNMQLRRAETAWKSGASILEAKIRVDRVLKARPGDGKARKLRAQVLLAMERPQEALQDAEAAVLALPEDGEAYVILCEAARLSGEQALAEAALDRAAELIFEDAALHLRLSWNAAQMNLLDRAEAFARIASAMAPDDPAAHYQLARVFLMKAQEEAAVAVLVRGLEAQVLDPAVIRQDSLLQQLTENPALTQRLR